MEPFLEERYSRLAALLEEAQEAGDGALSTLHAALLQAEGGLGAPLAKTRKRDRQTHEQLLRGTARLVVVPGAEPMAVDERLARSISALSESTGLNEQEAAQLVYPYVEDERWSSEAAAAAAARERWLVERRAQLYVLWRVLAAPLIDGGEGAMPRGARVVSVTTASSSRGALRSLLLRQRRRLLAECNLVGNLLARLGDADMLFDGERQALCRCLFLVAYLVQLTEDEVRQLLALFRSLVLMSGSGLTVETKARVAHGPLTGAMLSEAVDVIQTLFLVVRAALDPTRYHPLEDVRPPTSAAGATVEASNRLLASTSWTRALPALLHEADAELGQRRAAASAAPRLLLTESTVGPKDVTSTSLSGDAYMAQASQRLRWRLEGAADMLYAVQLVGALFLIAAPEASDDAAAVERCLADAVEACQRGALAALLVHTVPWIGQQQCVVLHRSEPMGDLYADLFSDMAMDMAAAGVVHRLFDAEQRALLRGALTSAAIGAPATAVASPPSHASYSAALLSVQLIRVLAAAARLCPDNAVRFSTEPILESTLDVVRWLGDSCLDFQDAVEAVLAERENQRDGEQGVVAGTGEAMLAKVPFAVLLAFLELLRYAAAGAEPVASYMQSGGHSVASLAALLRSMDTYVRTLQPMAAAAAAGSDGAVFEYMPLLPTQRAEEMEAFAALVRAVASLCAHSPDTADALRAEYSVVETCAQLLVLPLPLDAKAAVAEWLLALARSSAAAAVHVERCLQQRDAWRAPHGAQYAFLYEERDTGTFGLSSAMMSLAVTGNRASLAAHAEWCAQQVLPLWERLAYRDEAEAWRLASALSALLAAALRPESGTSARPLADALRRPNSAADTATSALRALLAVAGHACDRLGTGSDGMPEIETAAVHALECLRWLLSPSLSLESKVNGADGRERPSRLGCLLRDQMEPLRSVASAVRYELSASAVPVLAAEWLQGLFWQSAPLTAVLLTDVALSQQCTVVVERATDAKLLQAVVRLAEGALWAGHDARRDSGRQERDSLPFRQAFDPSGLQLLGVVESGMSWRRGMLATVLARLEAMAATTHRCGRGIWCLRQALPLFHLLRLVLRAEHNPALHGLFVPVLDDSAMLVGWCEQLTQYRPSTASADGVAVELWDAVLECTALWCVLAETETEAAAAARQVTQRVLEPSLRTAVALTTATTTTTTTTPPHPLAAWRRLFTACLQRIPVGDAEEETLNVSSLLRMARCLCSAPPTAATVVAHHHVSPRELACTDAEAAAALLQVLERARLPVLGEGNEADAHRYIERLPEWVHCWEAVVRQAIPSPQADAAARAALYTTVTRVLYGGVFPTTPPPYSTLSGVTTITVVGDREDEEDESAALSLPSSSSSVPSHPAVAEAVARAAARHLSELSPPLPLSRTLQQLLRDAGAEGDAPLRAAALACLQALCALEVPMRAHDIAPPPWLAVSSSSSSSSSAEAGTSLSSLVPLADRLADAALPAALWPERAPLSTTDAAGVVVRLAERSTTPPLQLLAVQQLYLFEAVCSALTATMLIADALARRLCTETALLSSWARWCTVVGRGRLLSDGRNGGWSVPLLHEEAAMATEAERRRLSVAVRLLQCGCACARQLPMSMGASTAVVQTMAHGVAVLGRALLPSPPPFAASLPPSSSSSSSMMGVAEPFPFVVGNALLWLARALTAFPVECFEAHGELGMVRVGLLHATDSLWPQWLTEEAGGGGGARSRTALPRRRSPLWSAADTDGTLRPLCTWSAPPPSTPAEMQRARAAHPCGGTLHEDDWWCLRLALLRTALALRGRERYEGGSEEHGVESEDAAALVRLLHECVRGARQAAVDVTVLRSRSTRKSAAAAAAAADDDDDDGRRRVSPAVGEWLARRREWMRQVYLEMLERLLLRCVDAAMELPAFSSALPPAVWPACRQIESCTGAEWSAAAVLSRRLQSVVHAAPAFPRTP